MILAVELDVVDKSAVPEEREVAWEAELVVLTGGVAMVESGESGPVRSTTTFDCSED